MKIMVFNTQHCLNYLEQKIDFDVMAKAITSCDPDVVGLNEMRGKGEDPEYGPQMDILSELTAMPVQYFAKAIDVKNHGPYGNGFLSKLPVESLETIPVPDPEVRIPGRKWYETRCLLKARLQNGVTVLVIHFGLNPDEQVNAVNTVLQHITDEKCILMGDFNCTPENEVLAPIRARMQDTADAFSEPLLSFPSPTPNRKIDYIFVSRDAKIIAADIPAIVASDHRPHTAEIEF